MPSLNWECMIPIPLFPSSMGQLFEMVSVDAKACDTCRVCLYMSIKTCGKLAQSSTADIIVMVGSPF